MSPPTPTCMQALWLENQTLVLRQEFPVPPIDNDQALIKVRLAGICATDLEMVRGYYPFTGIPGHEFVGQVVAAPEHPGWIDQRVVGEINISCGKCAACRLGNHTHCKNRKVPGIKDHHGVFAEYLALPVKNLHRVPASIPDDMAVFTEPLAAALEILQQIHIHPDDRVLLVGAGRLGQLVAQVLSMTGCDLHVLPRYPYQREILQTRAIPTLSIEQVESHAWDIVIEATGASSGFDLARRAVRPRGVLALKSTYKGAVKVDLSALVVDEITLVGSRCGPFPPALRAMQTGQVDPRPLISARYPLSQGLTAFEHANRPGALKILIEPD